jgi:Glyoxalase-like domain
MPKLDHLSVIAPSLEEGVAHLRAQLDLELPFGRKHAHMSTHNHLLRLGGGVYLEVIATDPSAPPIAGPRWFGLDDHAKVRAEWDAGRRLRGWVASTDHFDRHLAKHASVYGEKRVFQGGSSSYFFAVAADGSLPRGGVAPSLIDRQGKSPSLPAEAELGCTLLSFELEHPAAAEIEELYRALGVAGAPSVREGEAFRYTATIQTPSGIKVLS